MRRSNLAGDSRRALESTLMLWPGRMSHSFRLFRVMRGGRRPRDECV